MPLERKNKIMLHCRFCNKYLHLDQVRDIDFIDNGITKFTCNTCNYRTSSKSFYSLKDKVDNILDEPEKE